MEKIDPRELMTAIAEILDKEKIPYLVTGGMAVFVWGRPRFTADIDLVIELYADKLEKLEKALRGLGEAGYVDGEAMRNALSRSGEFNFIDSVTGMKVDFWISSRDDFDRSRLSRRIPKEIAGRTVYFSSPEDLILSKLRWWQETGSSRNAEDIKSIIAISCDRLDRGYLDEWARRLGYESLWRKANEAAQAD